MADRPGIYIGNRYLGAPVFGQIPDGARIVGAVFNDGQPPRWMTEEEWAAFPKGEPTAETMPERGVVGEG